MKKIYEWINAKLNIRFIVRCCGYYTAQDMVDFAEWYRNASDWSQGNCGAAMFRLVDFKKGISSESFED
jgi:hypothetical protein